MVPDETGDQMKHTLETTDAAIKRWETKLTRAMRQLSKLRLQRRRLEKAAAKPKVTVQASVPAHPTVDSETTLGALPPPEVKTTPAIDDIPEFLRRGVAASKAVDEVIAEQIKSEQAETKKVKARNRIEKMKAKQRGDTKKMPLTGKAALEFINKG